jgi:5-methylcytosine-specific restriction protein A
MRTRSKLERQFTDQLLENYRIAGAEVGYWATRFLGAVRRRGGLAQARAMLAPRNMNQRAGLDRLIDAKRPELTVEAAVLRPKFRSLFSSEELAIARARLADVNKQVKARGATDYFYPETVDGKQTYVEGARRFVPVNQLERSKAARASCVRHHGLRCAVCDVLMEEVYGRRGKGYIHVHHLRPAALMTQAYKVDPRRDLIPVCPNCHAMLHVGGKLWSIDDLRRSMRSKKKSS